MRRKAGLAARAAQWGGAACLSLGIAGAGAAVLSERMSIDRPWDFSAAIRLEPHLADRIRELGEEDAAAYRLAARACAAASVALLVSSGWLLSKRAAPPVAGPRPQG
jgi:hypothetical protein